MNGLGMTDQELVCGAGAILARMTKSAGGPSCLAMEADQDRVVALLSVMKGLPVASSDVLHHVEAAACHWRRGDKALANFRLIFSDLPRLGDPAAAHRLHSKNAAIKSR